MPKIKTGDPIPEFKVKDHEGYDLTNEDIMGVPTVIYFYPKDETPGCTKEACDFQNNIRKFDELDTLILGVSPDSVESHKKFIDNHDLEFTLLSDEDMNMCKSFGVVNKGAIVRSTFVIDMEGIVKWKEKSVDVEGHTDRVIKAVKKHCPKQEEISPNLEGKFSEFTSLFDEALPSEEESEKKEE